MKAPDAILTSDWHIRETKPKCRTDTYWMGTQTKKILFIKQQAERIENETGNKVPILHGGDLFDHWKPSPFLLSFCLSVLPELVIVPGNHDLPAHNLDRLGLSGLNVLDAAGRLLLFSNTTEMRFHNTDFRICGFPFGTKLKSNKLKSNSRQIAVTHTFVYKGKAPFPGAKGKLSSIAKYTKGYDLIVTGDNHQPFTHRFNDGRLLVNPGSLLRLTALQMDHKPRIYFWYAKENEVEPVYIPIDTSVVSREHLETDNKRNDRVRAYIEKLSSEMELGLDFEKNLNEFLIRNNVSKAVRIKIMEVIEK